MPEAHKEGIWDEGIQIGKPEGMIPIKEMTVGELLILRGEIDALLPPMQLNSISLEEELMRQFHVARSFQTEVISSHEEANKKAQVMNTCAATIQALVKMQADFHTSERLKNIETRLIRCLEKVPTEYLEEFFEWYESQTLD